MNRLFYLVFNHAILGGTTPGISPTLHNSQALPRPLSRRPSLGLIRQGADLNMIFHRPPLLLNGWKR